MADLSFKPVSKLPAASADRVHPLAHCEDCPLWGCGHALSAGPVEAKVAIVSRSPGTHDVMANKPFAGPTGKIVDYLLEENGVKRSDVFQTNVVLCQTEKPPQAAIDACHPRLEYELIQAKPDVIIAAGAEPVNALLGMGLKEARGRRHRRTIRPLTMHPDKFHVVEVVATFNPAVVMRDDGVFPDLKRDFRRALNEPEPYSPPTIGFTESVTDARRYLEAILSGQDDEFKRISCDIESTGLSTLSELVSVGFGTSDSEGFVLGTQVCRSEAGRQLLSDFFSRYTGDVIWHNGKFDAKILRQCDIPAPIDHDTLLMNYALDERGGVHGLEYMTQDQLDWPDYETEEVTEAKKHGFKEEPDVEFKVTGWTKTNRERIAKGENPKTPIRIGLKCTYKGVSDWPGVYRYNGYDCVGSYKIAERLLPRVADDGVSKAYDLTIRASNALVEVERRGIQINVQRAQEMVEKEVRPRLAELKFRAECIVGRHLNLNSHLQCASILYDSFGLREPVYRPGKDRSTDAFNRDEWLRTITSPTTRDFIETLDEFKKLDKLRGTYLEGLVAKLDSDGRLRCELLLHGTETGRLSSRRPNLQNIPRVDPGAKYVVPNIKSIFQARPGFVILQVDYSQAELRCAAIISGDVELQRVYAENLDLHSEVARDNFGDNYSKEQRVYAKAVNFGILYGIGEFKLAQELTRRTAKTVSPSTAGLMIQRWWQRFPQVKEWVDSVHKQIKTTGELQSVFGRKRRFHLLTNDNLGHSLKEGVNFEIQSPASDLTLSAVCELVEHQAPVWLAVHDSILLEVPYVELDQWATAVKEVMEHQAKKELGWDDIPFTADVQWGYDWGNLNDWELVA